METDCVQHPKARGIIKEIRRTGPGLGVAGEGIIEDEGIELGLKPGEGLVDQKGQVILGWRVSGFSLQSRESSKAFECNSALYKVL